MAHKVGVDEVLARLQSLGLLLGPDAVHRFGKRGHLCFGEDLGQDQKALFLEVPALVGGDEVLQALNIHAQIPS